MIHSLNTADNAEIILKKIEIMQTSWVFAETVTYTYYCTV